METAICHLYHHTTPPKIQRAFLRAYFKELFARAREMSYLCIVIRNTSRRVSRFDTLRCATRHVELVNSARVN